MHRSRRRDDDDRCRRCPPVVCHSENVKRWVSLAVLSVRERGRSDIPSLPSLPPPSSPSSCVGRSAIITSNKESSKLHIAAPTVLGRRPCETRFRHRVPTASAARASLNGESAADGDWFGALPRRRLTRGLGACIKIIIASSFLFSSCHCAVFVDEWSVLCPGSFD